MIFYVGFETESVLGFLRLCYRHCIKWNLNWRKIQTKFTCVSFALDCFCKFSTDPMGNFLTFKQVMLMTPDIPAIVFASSLQTFPAQRLWTKFKVCTFFYCWWKSTHLKVVLERQQQLVFFHGVTSWTFTSKNPSSALKVTSGSCLQASSNLIFSEQVFLSYFDGFVQ